LDQLADEEVFFTASGTIIPGDLGEFLAETRALNVREFKMHDPQIRQLTHDW
jgi:hypothetical protein